MLDTCRFPYLILIHVSWQTKETLKYLIHPNVNADKHTDVADRDNKSDSSQRDVTQIRGSKSFMRGGEAVKVKWQIAVKQGLCVGVLGGVGGWTVLNLSKWPFKEPF